MISDSEKAAQKKWVDFVMTSTKAFKGESRNFVVKSRRAWRHAQEGLQTITVPEVYGDLFEEYKVISCYIFTLFIH